MNWALYGFAAWYAIGVLMYISRIGQPRKPISPADAVTVICITAGLVVVMVMAAGRLS